MTSNIVSSLILISLFTALGRTEPITTGTLFQEMTDMKRLMDFPDPAYRTVQFSSYDHRSVHPGGPDWFANSDGFGREPIPNFERVLKEPDDKGIGEYLVCDVEGPGAIVREWTAAIRGTIRLELDGNLLYEGSADDFFRRTYETFAEQVDVDPSIFENTFSQRNAGYYPIPFAKRCRIVWIGNVREIHFYQLQIRFYEKEAVIKTFQSSDLITYKKEMKRATSILADPDGEWIYQSKNKPIVLSAQIPPKESQEILSLEGPKALERLTLKVQAEDLDRALRQTILHIKCDEYPWGQVQAPIGDFFGAAPGINPMNTVPFTIHPDGTMTCRYVMPFKQSLSIQIENRGEQKVTVTGSVLPMDYEWDDETSMHFRARWRIDHDLTASGEAVQDLPFLIANGKGVYVGTVSYLLNPNPVPHSGGNWWGEGDEKIFIDDDSRPSTFGTGSEDYYNYAWSAVDIFVFPYFAQPRNDGPANRGFVTNNRFHILDPLPFEYRLSFYMELFSHETTPGVSYARLAYHYARPGLMDDHLPITNEDIRHLELPADWRPASRGAAKDSVFYQAEELVLEGDDLSLVEDNLWSGARLMVWKPRESKKTLTFNVPVLEDGNYTIHFTCALNNQSGAFSVSCANQKLKFEKTNQINLFIPYRTLLRDFPSQTISLKKGVTPLTLLYEGPSRKDAMKTIGIDFIWVQKR